MFQRTDSAERTGTVESGSSVRAPISLRLQDRSPRQILHSREKSILERAEMENLVTSTVQEIRRKIIYIQSINCLREGFSLEDLPTYLQTLDTKKKMYERMVALQTSRILEREMAKQTMMLEEAIRRENKFLVTLREIQGDSLNQLQSRCGD